MTAMITPRRTAAAQAAMTVMAVVDSPPSEGLSLFSPFPPSLDPSCSGLAVESASVGVVVVVVVLVVVVVVVVVLVVVDVSVVVVVVVVLVVVVLVRVVVVVEL